MFIMEPAEPPLDNQTTPKIQKAVIRKVYMRQSQELMQKFSSKSHRQLIGRPSLQAFKQSSEPLAQD